jgi:hypothetical protein
MFDPIGVLFYFLGIRKLVMEVFQNMWFTPVRERPSLDSAALLRKVMNITDVVAATRDMGLEWFEQLLLSVSINPSRIAVIFGFAKYL